MWLTKDKSNEELNKVRYKIEVIVEKVPLWFTLLYEEGGSRVKFGIKLEGNRMDEDAIDIKKKVEDEIKKEYPMVVVEDGNETDVNCELAALASQCRRLIEQRKRLSEWSRDDLILFLHFLLNPFGYDDEARTYIQLLIDVSDRVTNPDLKGVTSNMVAYLQHNGKLQFENGRWVHSC